MAAQSSPRPIADRETFLNAGKNEASSPAVSWAAVIGGAFVAASLSLILLSLGTGLGFSAVSPWTHNGASAAAIGAGAIVWLILTQIAASALGGYLGGRLRTKWTHVHTDEVYFRDTAHGLLVWAVGIVITAGFLASAAASFAGAERTLTSLIRARTLPSTRMPISWTRCCEAAAQLRRKPMQTIGLRYPGQLLTTCNRVQCRMETGPIWLSSSAHGPGSIRRTLTNA
jgi:hypothetical protein